MLKCFATKDGHRPAYDLANEATQLITDMHTLLMLLIWAKQKTKSDYCDEI